MSRKYLGFLVAIVFVFALAVIPVGAQDGPSVTVNDQISSGNVIVAEVVSDGPGWVVIRNDGGGRGTPGVVVGFAAVSDGVNTDVVVPLNASLATAQLFAALHTDDGEAGLFEFQKVAGGDAPVVVNGDPVQQTFNIQLIQMVDQFVSEDNTVTLDNVVTNAPGWLVIHAGDAEKFGAVLGQTQLRAGLNRRVRVEIASDGRTEVLWPMLHVDTGEIGTYEFGTVEGADGPVVVNGEVATLPVWTVPHVRMSDQFVLNEDGSPPAEPPTVTADSVLSQGPGFLVIHSNANGAPGPVLGFTAVDDGQTSGVTVTLDQGEVTPVVWPMLHVDTGEIGTYEFGAVEGADVPARDSAGNVITFPINIAPPGSTTQETSGSESAAATGCTVSPTQNVNRRGGPNTNFAVVGSLAAGASAEVTGQATNASGEQWWLLADGSWVRSDVVVESGSCDGVPAAEAPAEPATTPEPGSGG